MLPRTGKLRAAQLSLGTTRALALSGGRRRCLASQPRIGQGRGIYPAGTPALQIRAGKRQGPFASQPTCGLKPALRSLAQGLRCTDTGRLVRQQYFECAPGIRFGRTHREASTRAASNRTRGGRAPHSQPGYLQTCTRCSSCKLSRNHSSVSFHFPAGV